MKKTESSPATREDKKNYRFTLPVEILGKLSSKNICRLRFEVEVMVQLVSTFGNLCSHLILSAPEFLCRRSESGE
jgi:hypothetical protein